MTADLSAWLAELSRSPEPVSFVDACEVARRVRRAGDPTAEVLAGLIAVHDAPDTTLGAREILAELLRGLATRLARERELAKRPLTFADHLGTLRGPPGLPVQIQLDERRGLGLTWEVEDVSSELALSRAQEDGAHAGQAVFEFALPARGRYQLCLCERPTLRARPGTKPRPVSRPRTFRLELVAE